MQYVQLVLDVQSTALPVYMTLARMAASQLKKHTSIFYEDAFIF